MDKRKAYALALNGPAIETGGGEAARAARNAGQPEAMPETASPGAIKVGPDGRTYQYVETRDMAGATGDYGWIPVNL